MTASFVDVLVIGMGPAGLMCALSLAKAGISTKIVDKRHPGQQYGNPDGIQPRTLEIWQTYKILESFVGGSVPMHAMVTYNHTIINGKPELTRTRPVRNIIADSRFPYERTASISHIEGTLRQGFVEAGGSVQYSTIPTNIEVIPGEKYAVKVSLQNVWKEGHGTQNDTHSAEVVRAQYVVGADGKSLPPCAHSWVRRFLHIPLEGDLTESIWGVTDVLVETNFSDCRMKAIINAPTGTIILIPREEEKVRLYVQLSLSDCPLAANGCINKASLSGDVARRVVLNRIIAGMAPFQIRFPHIFWSTIFAIPQRVAKRFSFEDRVFIVGDACHQHSPKAGQGANAAMGDSHNLAWKLAHTIKGWATTKLLRTYEMERKSYAHQLIEFDKEISAALESEAPETYESVLHRQNVFTSGTGIRYKSPPLTVKPPHDAGERVIAPGMYLPWCSVTRLADWEPMDLQDLITFDGLWRVLILPGDVHHPQSQKELAHLEIEFSRSTTLLRYSALYTILDNHEDEAQWTDVPKALQSWKK